MIIHVAIEDDLTPDPEDDGLAVVEDFDPFEADPEEYAAREGLCSICSRPSDTAECDLCWDAEQERWPR